MIKNLSNINFQGKYIFKGTGEKAKPFVELMEKAHRQEPNSFYNFKTIEDNGDTYVFTGYDALDIDKNNQTKAIKYNKFYKAELLYDAEKNELKPDVLHIDPVQKLVGVKNKEGITRFYHRYINYDSKQFDQRVFKYNFNQPIPLETAIRHVENLFDEKRINVLKDMLKKSKEMNEIKVTEILGAGFWSFVFKTSDNKALKLSLAPCYPKKLEIFDLPILDKGFIKLKKDIVYYTICPVGDNANNTRIKKSDYEYLRHKISTLGYETAPDFKIEQIVLVDGKPYICDYDCIEYQNEKSRMFKASWF